ncbi:hypothetical protein D3C80_2149030 [compost metagenome]
MTHAGASRELHFAFLHMEARIGKHVVVACMVIMQVRSDDVLHIATLHANS